MLGWGKKFMPANWKSVREIDIKKGDIVILLIGQTGTGKSTFINTATQKHLLKVHQGLTACTTSVGHVRSNFPDEAGDGHGVVFVDTPPIGVDDSKEQERAEKLIYKWKQDALDKRNIKLSGVLYLYRISDNRMPEPPLPQYNKFAEIFKADVPTLLVTTMWDRPPDKNVKDERQKTIASRWKGLGGKEKKTKLDLTSEAEKNEDKTETDVAISWHDGSYKSAWRIVDELLTRATPKPATLSIAE